MRRARRWMMLALAAASGCGGDDEGAGGAGGGVNTTSSTATGSAGSGQGGSNSGGASSGGSGGASTGGAGGGTAGAGGAEAAPRCEGFTFIGSCDVPGMAQCREYYATGGTLATYGPMVKSGCQGLSGATWSDTEPCSFSGDLGWCEIASPPTEICWLQVDYPPEDPDALEGPCVDGGGAFHPPEPP